MVSLGKQKFDDGKCGGGRVVGIGGGSWVSGCGVLNTDERNLEVEKKFGCHRSCHRQDVETEGEF